MSSKIFEGVLRFEQRLITETNLIFISEPFRRFAVIVQCFYEQCKLRVVFQNEFSAADNLFLNGAKPMTDKEQGWTMENEDPNLRIEETADGVYLISDIDCAELAAFKGKPVDAQRLGVAKLSGYPFENPDGTPFVLDKDYFGKTRSGQAPTVGPVETLPHGNRIKVW